jgi:hypothetical protein
VETRSRKFRACSPDEACRADGQGGNFSIDVVIRSKKTEFSLLAIGVKGEVEKYSFEILFPDWEKFLETLYQSKKKLWNISPGIGVVGVFYRQTSISDVNEWGLATKVSGTYEFRSGRWNLGGNAYYTPWIFYTSQSGMSIQFLGGNLRLGYVIPQVRSPWRLNVMAGGYFATSFSSPSTFGYANIFGPQLYPVLQRGLSKNRLVWAYGKYSPIMSGGSLLTFDNAEIALGGGFSFSPLKSGHVVSATLDLSILELQFTGGSVQSTTVTLGGSYTF